MPVLKLKRHNERKEIDFELDYLLSLTVQERFRMMFARSQEILQRLKRNGPRNTPQVFKRA